METHSGSGELKGEPPSPWISTREAAERLGVSLRTVYRLIDGGELAAYQIGRNIRVKESDLVRFVDSRRITPGALRHLYSFESVDEDVQPR